MKYFVLSFAIFYFVGCASGQPLRAPAQADDSAFNDQKVLAEKYGYSTKNCESPAKKGASWPWDPSGKLLPECLPDTLYSWHKIDMVKAIIAKATEQVIMPDLNLYLWRTPIGSFGYGDIAMRLKLWPDTLFIDTKGGNRSCKFLNARYGTERPIVYVNFLGTKDTKSSEYMICSAKAVLSWSVNEPQSLVEAQLELDWINTHTPDQYDHLLRAKSGPPWNYGTYDDGNWDRSKLDANLANFGNGSVTPAVFYSAESVHTLEEHFRTEHPSYFNPNFGAASELKRLNPIHFSEVNVISASIKSVDSGSQDTDVTEQILNFCLHAEMCTQTPDPQYTALLNSLVHLEANDSRTVTVKWKCSADSTVREAQFEISQAIISGTQPSLPMLLDCSGK